MQKSLSRLIALVFLVMTIATGCTTRYALLEFSREWTYDDFAAIAQDHQRQSGEQWIMQLPPFYLEAASHFAPVGRSGDVVMVYAIDTSDYGIYRYCLVRSGEVTKQFEFKLPKRI